MHTARPRYVFCKFGLDMGMWLVRAEFTEVLGTGIGKDVSKIFYL